ncbi:hypothetical protein [Nocardioides pacificus]
MSPRLVPSPALNAALTAALTVSLSVGLALAAAPASADSHVVRDAARDVRSQGIDDDVIRRPEPTRTEGDVRSLRVTHGPRNVRLTLRLARLTRVPAAGVVHVFALRTDEGRRADLGIYVAKRDWQGERMWSVEDRDRACRGLRTRVDYRADTVRAVVPRRCLSNPAWIRVGGGHGMLDGERLYADDVSRKGRVGEDVVVEGPRIRRG